MSTLQNQEFRFPEAGCPCYCCASCGEQTSSNRKVGLDDHHLVVGTVLI